MQAHLESQPETSALAVQDISTCTLIESHSIPQSSGQLCCIRLTLLCLVLPFWSCYPAWDQCRQWSGRVLGALGKCAVSAPCTSDAPPPPFQLALINGTEKIFHKGVKSHRLVLFRRGKTVACWPLEEIWQYYFPFISEDTQGLKREHLFPI